MSVAPAGAGDLHHLTIDRPDDFDGWREQARTMAAAYIPPECIVWSADGRGERDLFGGPGRDLAPIPSSQRSVRANKAFLRLARSVMLHKEPARFALLYKLLLRLQDDPHLMEKVADREAHRLTVMAGHVRRDIHKMRAFVRFRAIKESDGTERYVAWFEPDHHILRANADFFLNRFASQRWSILTPGSCVHWDGKVLTETSGANRNDAPAEDATEDLWRRYYGSIFNPARLKVAMMVKEMPRRYWKNLPEARMIPELIAGAQAREADMVAQGVDTFPEALPARLEEIAQDISLCRRCPIGCNGTRSVPGEGPERARLLIVGEQPGDQEEREGRPFVGPAGQLLDEHLNRAGFDRSLIRVTNAVKHFKFVPRGKKRLHQRPNAGEIKACKFWLNLEMEFVKPKLVVAMGATAVASLAGSRTTLSSVRGKVTMLEDGTRMFATVHPSFLLRMPDREQAKIERERFVEDLRAVKKMMGH